MSTQYMSTTTKMPKVTYKKQLRTEMMKSFNRFFSSSSPEIVDGAKSKNPGEDPIHDLRSHMQELSEPTSNSQEKDGYDLEFDSLTKFENTLSRESNMFKSARLTKNSKKNKFSKVLPNEKTRVVLGRDDYINANHISTHKNFSIPYRYIATQAPISETVADFWRMVYENKSKVIVMLAEIEEEEESFGSASRCIRYWPQLGTEQMYGNLLVESTCHLVVNDVVIQEFMITDQDGNQFKTNFLQYLGWPDMGVPKNSQSLHDLFEKIDEIYAEHHGMGPIIVHCSAGIGRTGTFIAIQTIREQLKKVKDKSRFNYDIYNTVKELKAARIGMVQRKEQYMFCYQAVLDEAERLKLL